jgi:hypothetical protein
MFFVLIELRSELEPKGVPGGGFEDDSMMEKVNFGEFCLEESVRSSTSAI